MKNVPVLFIIIHKTRGEGNWDICTGKYIEEPETEYYVVWCGNFVAYSGSNINEVLDYLKRNYQNFKYTKIDARGWKL